MLGAVPIALAQLPPDDTVRCSRGRQRPRAIAWFGFSSFWGHVRHLLASAIATENIDSRTWMIPDPPHDLLARAIDRLEPRGARPAATLAAAREGELWIDFVADTGDDATVSEAVARLVAAEYEAVEPGSGRRLVLPRGDVLILGGDLAYPVATVSEMTRRLIVPWNRVLEPLSDPAAPRVLLAIPGNHDWYDGLDGFSRLCQAPCAFEHRPEERETLYPTTQENPVLAWAEAFTSGDVVHKPGAVALAGYVPIQRASYFRLPLARGLELVAVDRQLSRIDPRQLSYFAVPSDARARLVLLPDPARAWGEVRPYGVASLRALGIDPLRMPTFVLAGDVHHYERSREGRSVHVVAGGGGAFLHGARVAGRAAYARDVEFPGPRASRAMLARLPWRVARGGAGWVITSLFGVGDALALSEFARFAGQGRHVAESAGASLSVAAFMSVTVAVGTALLVGWRRHRARRVIPFALALGVIVGALPVTLGMAIDALGLHELGVAAWARVTALLAAWMIATWASGFAFGAVLELIARLGLNHAQPYAALGEPGFRHFVRMRVTEHASGSSVDVFAIGVVDPVGKSPPVLVDSFRWPTSGG